MDTGDDSQQQTALHVILRNCEQYSAKPALHWLNMNCKVTEKYTYEEVEYRSRELARGLLGLVHSQRKESGSSAAVVEVRERAVLCFPPGLEFLLTFLACLRAGIIAGESAKFIIIIARLLFHDT
jgi:acyl-CoA synthetase (AMP-forming)/AMP-acid ligase II